MHFYLQWLGRRVTVIDFKSSRISKIVEQTAGTSTRYRYYSSALCFLVSSSLPVHRFGYQPYKELRKSLPYPQHKLEDIAR
jgi:hypothetical protein